MKQCRECGLAAPEVDFPTKGRLCKPCTAVARKEWRRRNPDAVRAMKARYNRSPKGLEAVRRWKRENAERVAAYPRDPERRRAQQSAYKKTHPEKVAIHAHRRRANMRGSYTTRDWRRLIERHGGACAYCGTKGPLTVDHVVPLSRGGTNNIGNILPACGPCNGSKGNKTLTEWRKRRGARRIPQAIEACSG